MSVDWTLYCKDCEKKPDFEIYSGHILQEVYRLREHILALIYEDKSGYLGVSIMSYSVNDLWSFLKEHKDHTIELMTEYGEVFSLDKEGNVV